MKQFLKSTTKCIEIVNDNPVNHIPEKINCRKSEDKEDAFFLADLGDVVRKHKLWSCELPRVEPFYAVKCNNDSSLLNVLAHLGIGFDCASKAEIQTIMDMNVSADRIIYANPCKQNSHIRYAAKNNVSLMTFDNMNELHKIKAHYPNARLVVRIRPPDDSKAQCQLGMKYGCEVSEVPALLLTAKKLKLSVVGVSFHVGSGCYDVTAFPKAVAAARVAFDMGMEAGFKFEMLDIGGGFPGQKSALVSFEEICAPLRKSLDTHFPESSGVRIIAEPGRFFAASAFTLMVNIIAKRTVPRDQPDNADDDITYSGDLEPKFMYYVNDGVYGSFNCLLYDHAAVEASLFEPEQYKNDLRYSASVWGPTCDGLDCIVSECQLPELRCGDWLIFHNMGAYTMCASSTFNGMPRPRVHYAMQDVYWHVLTGLDGLDESTKHGILTPALLKCRNSDLTNLAQINYIPELRVIDQ